MKIRWLLLADLHFQFDGKKFDTDDLREKLIAKLTKMKEKEGNFDFVFIAGDIFNKGQNTGGKKEDIIKYLKKVADSAGCVNENIIICAGNHDLKRNRARADNLKSIIEVYEETKNLELSEYAPLVIDSVCKPFNDCCKEINSKLNFESVHYIYSSEYINVYVINTAIFSGQTYPGKNENAEKNEHLYICDENLSNLKCPNKEKLNIVLAHHGTEYFVDKDRFFRWLRDNGIDLYLCGHVHKEILKTLDAANAAHQVSCGGLFVDDYNSPSFIVGGYDTENGEITLSNYQYVLSVGDWRSANNLAEPYDNTGKVKWVIPRLVKKNNVFKPITTQNNITDSNIYELLGVKKISMGYDRDKDFIEIRKRARSSITILGVGMSKLSKYALNGPGSLEKMSQNVDIDLLMYDPEYIEKNEAINESFEDFFGIQKFKENIRMAYNTLKDFCEEHNQAGNCRHRITLSVYTSIPTMSAVAIDGDTENGEIVVEYFGYKCGQSRLLLLLKKCIKCDNDNLYESINEQIKNLKKNSRRIVK